MPTPSTFQPASDLAFPDDPGVAVWTERRTLPVVAFFGVPAAMLAIFAAMLHSVPVRVALAAGVIALAALGVRAHRRALIETFALSDEFLTVVQPGGGRVAVPVSSIERIRLVGDQIRVEASVGTLTLGFVRGQRSLMRALEPRVPGLAVERDFAAFCPT